MNMHEECLKRQNEGYHTPLPEVIERIERDSRKLKPSYAVLDIQDTIFYLKYLESLIQKAYEKAHEREIKLFLYGDNGDNKDENRKSRVVYQKFTRYCKK